MTTNTEFVAAEELVIETSEQGETIELSMAELDLVGGGSFSVVY